ncbi:MAG: SPOCS domain-containing protein [Lachnospirales bacterium]
MELNMTTIKLNSKIANEKSQLLLDCDLVADTKPAIEKILKACGRVIIDTKEVMEDRVNFKGRFLSEVIYISKGDNEICSLSGEAPVNDFAEVKGAKNGMKSKIGVDISNIDYSLINDRKVSISAMADLLVSVNEDTVLDAIENISDIPKSCQRLTTIVSDVVVSDKKDSFNINEEITLPQSKLPISQILTVEANIINPDLTTAEDSVKVRGDGAVTIMYISDEGGMPQIYETDLPFEGVFEAEGVKEGMSVNGSFVVDNIYYNIEENENGENRIIELDINVITEFQVTESIENEILEDAYSTGNEINMDIEKICATYIVCQNKSQYPVKETVTLDETAPDMLQIFKTSGKPYIDEIKIEDNKVIIDGVINTDIMYVTGNDETPVYNYKAAIPFSQTVDARGAKEGMEAEVSSAISHIGFNMLSDREVEVRCALNTNTIVTNNVCVNVPIFAEIKPLDEEALNKLPSMVIYVVKPGDTLWKLAKRFNSTVEDIAELNNIENPDLIYPGQRFIILKRVAL